MPSGVYPRSDKQKALARIHLQKGREPEARKKATQTLRKTVWSREDYRERLSKATTQAMHSPTVRKKHLKSLSTARKQHGVNFKGGNGQTPSDIIIDLTTVFKLFGFKREMVIKTRGHGTHHKPPDSYKADFGHARKMVVIEVDGPCHNPRAKRKLDQKKQEVLEALGWTVYRIRHK